MMEIAPQRNRRVLVIDDNPAIHDDFRKILAFDHTSTALDAAETAVFGGPTSGLKRAYFQIDSAFQGQEGIEKVRDAMAASATYALAFIDVRMPPGWDGVESAVHIW